METKKKKKLKSRGLLLLALLTLTCCHSGKPQQATTQEGDTLHMQYARLLTLIQHPTHTEAIIRNPWDSTRTLHHYAMYSGNLPESLPADITPVRIPLQNAAVFTSVHCGLIHELGGVAAIGGVCEVKYIHNPTITEGVQRGDIMDLGNGMSPNIERIIALQPDALLASPFEHNGGYGRLEKLGIPIIECAEYMEVSPLAQAEWMRFYGRLFGKGPKADSLFAETEIRYRTLKEKANRADTRPLVLAELPLSGKWHVPAGSSTTGLLYHDAGATYAFEHISGSGSMALSIEQVLDKALHADFWLVKRFGDATRQQLTEDVPALKRIAAPMWLCNTEESLYYEEAPYHPDWLLSNLIAIFHPELGIVSSKTYFSLVK